MKRSSEILITALILLLWNGVSFAQTATEKLQCSVMSKQSLKIEKLASTKVLDHGMPMEKAVYLIHVRSNDPNKTWHVQSNLVDHGKPVLSGKFGEFTQKVEVTQPLGSGNDKANFYLSSEV